LFIGRATMYPLALEGALKLKEISYIHAEGFAAGELKHGSIALVDESVPIITIAPDDELFEKTISNMQEVMARGGQVVMLGSAAGIEKASEGCMATISLPELDPFITPMLYALPLQLLAYYAAVTKGTDVDQPRNLAKSVTVE
jgi:glucosamine--fructose-6-phosphate aminotransferase (isomerizing)